MDRDAEAAGGVELDAGDTPEARWLAWGIWSCMSLSLVLLGVVGAGFDTGLLLGWVVGIIVAAMLMVLGRK